MGKGIMRKNAHFTGFVRSFEYDTSIIHLPRHSSFTINHTFVNLGIVRHNMAESLANTTVSTTKGHRENGDKGKCVGSIP